MYLFSSKNKTGISFWNKCFPSFHYCLGFLFFRNKACDTETVLSSAKKSNTTLPVSLLPVPGDSDFCVNPLPQAVFPVVQADVPSFSLPIGISNQAPHPSMPAASKTENGKPTLVPNQPFLCFPSSSLFMLCGGLQENNLSEALPTARELGSRNAEAQAAIPATVCQKRSSQKCLSPSAPGDDEEPAAKKQTLEHGDLPLSLVVPKVKRISLSLRPSHSKERLLPKTVFSEGIIQCCS